MEILDKIDLNKLQNPKLFCGCSDNSILTFIITTCLDIASVYGHNFYELGIRHEVIDNYISFLENKCNIQNEITLVSKKDDSWKSLEPQIEYNLHKIEQILNTILLKFLY